LHLFQASIGKIYYVTLNRHGIQFRRAIPAYYIRIGLVQTTKTTVMKLIYFLLISLFTSLSSFCQADKFFVSISSSLGFGGPAPSIQSTMKSLQYTKKTFLGSGHSPSLILKTGLKVNEYHSLYLIFGQFDQASVSRFRTTGYESFWGLWDYKVGEKITVNFTTMQYGVGYQFEFPESRWKLGLGPSVFVLDYEVSTNSPTFKSDRKVTAGASFSARIPIGKGKKAVGIEFVSDLTLAPSVTLQTEAYRLHNVSASMCRGTFGVAFTYRHKNNIN
jgi:hypothetical protein